MALQTTDGGSGSLAPYLNSVVVDWIDGNRGVIKLPRASNSLGGLRITDVADLSDSIDVELERGACDLSAMASRS